LKLLTVMAEKADPREKKTQTDTFYWHSYLLLRHLQIHPFERPIYSALMGFLLEDSQQRLHVEDKPRIRNMHIIPVLFQVLPAAPPELQFQVFHIYFMSSFLFISFLFLIYFPM